MTLRLSRTVAFAAIMSALTTGASASIEIVNLRWGLSEAVTPKSHALLSLSLRNRGKSCDVLIQVQNVERSLSIEREVFADTGAVFRLGFPIWVSPELGGYVISWKTSDGRSGLLPLALPVFGPPGRAFLDSENPARRLESGIAGFPASELPSRLPLLESVDSLLIAHEPQWTPEQRVALKDWIWCGGRLHVFYRDDGRWPRFEGELEFLNVDKSGKTEKDNSNVMLFGAGLVVHQSRGVWGVTNLELARQGYPLSPGNQALDANSYIDSRSESEAYLARNLPILTYSWTTARLIIVLYAFIVGVVPFVMARMRRSQLSIFVVMGVSVVVASYLLFQLSAADRARGNSMARVRLISCLPGGGYERGYELFATPQARRIDLEERSGFLDALPRESGLELLRINDGAVARLSLECPDLSRQEIYRARRSASQVPESKVLDYRWDSTSGRPQLMEARFSRPEQIEEVGKIQFAMAVTDERVYDLDDSWASAGKRYWQLADGRSTELEDWMPSLAARAEELRYYRNLANLPRRLDSDELDLGMLFALRMLRDGKLPVFKIHRLEPRRLGKRIEIIALVEGGDPEEAKALSLPVVSDYRIYHWTLRIPYED